MIEAQHISKWFGPNLAVDDVSFTVERGDVLGFLGPNGAGKSTSMRMITGFLPLSGGKVSIGGHDIEASPIAAKSLVGYLPENAPAYPDVTPMARALVAAAPDRIVWGTDWPHPGARALMPEDHVLADLLAQWVPDEAQRRKVLVENPARLYGF